MLWYWAEGGPAGDRQVGGGSSHPVAPDAHLPNPRQTNGFLVHAQSVHLRCGNTHLFLHAQVHTHVHTLSQAQVETEGCANQ